MRLGAHEPSFRSTAVWLVLLGVLGAGCQGPPVAAAAEPSGGSTPETRKKAKPSPPVIAAGQKVLAEHADAPIGSEFRIEIEGKPFLARIEEHDNSSGDPTRPAGKHKGVTVYEP